MAVNLLQAQAINTGLMFSGDSGTSLVSGMVASEVPLLPDNVNKGLSMYTQIMGCWEGFTPGIWSNYQSDTSRNQGSWWQPHGYDDSWAARPRGAFFIRSVVFNDELTRYGYVSSLVGGYLNRIYSFDQASNGAVSYETPYGNGAPTSWPIANTDQAKVQFRDAASLPSDGSSRISLTGSAWNRSAYLHPCYYCAHIVTGGAVSSGAVSFFLEQRPSWRMTQGLATSTHSLEAYDPGQWFPQVTDAHMKILQANAYLQGYPSSPAAVTVPLGGVAKTPDDPAVLAVAQTPVIPEARQRQTATFMINEEYYGQVFGSLIMVYSNKMSARPIWLYDFAQDVWAASTAKRIAGVAVNGLDLWVLSEAGDLAQVDFSVSGGQVVAKASAPVVTGEERYGAMVRQGSKLWALVGTHTRRLNAPTATGTLGVVSFDLAAGTWGARSNSPLQARHNTRSLYELIALADGRLAALTECVGSLAPAVTDLLHLGMANSYAIQVDLIGKTTVTRISGADVMCAVSRTKVKLGILPTALHVRAVIKWLPIGSPAGTPFSGSAQVLFGGSELGTTTNSEQWDTAPTLLSDWVTLPWDPMAYDYYVYIYAESGTGGAVWWNTETNNTPRGWAGSNILAASVVTGDARDSATAPGGLAPLVAGAMWGLIADPEEVGSPMVYNVGAPTYQAGWQVLVFNPTGSTWNTSQVTIPTFIYGNLGGNSRFEILPNTGAFMEVAPNKLLVQANWRNTKLFVVDVGGTLDATAIKDVSYGSASTICSSGMNPTVGWLTFIKNLTDSSVLCWPAAPANPYFSTYGIAPSLASPGFAWDGSEKMQLLASNTYGSSVTTAIAKDGFYPADIGAQAVSYGYYTEWAFPVSYADNQLTVSVLGGEVDATGISGARKGHGVYYLPRYWKWTGTAWSVAKNWADAAASPYTVSATPDTAINGPHGLVLHFGPAAGTTFLAGEFHTINVTYGQVKFARRSRWSFTMFAGRTFRDTATKNIADLNTLGYRRILIGVEAPLTVSGPAGISTPMTPYGDNHTVTWPVASGGVANDAPAVVTYDLTQVTTNLPISVAGAVVTASPGMSTWTPTEGSIRVDYGAGHAPVVVAYELGRFGFDDTLAMAGWSLQGSNDDTTTPTNWTTLDTVTSYTWPTGINYRVTHALRQIPGNTTGYRHYRIVLQTGGYGYLRVASFSLYDQPFGVANFADLMLGPEDNQNGMTGVPLVYGLKFEVNHTASPDTAGFTEIIPKFRAHNGLFYCFDRQTDVKQLRITTQLGGWWNDTTRQLPPVQLWDYASQAVMDSLRLGSSAAADNTSARGAFDSQCLGVGCDATTITVDGGSPALWSPMFTSKTQAALGWFLNPEPPTAGKYKIHPFYGFLRLPTGTSGTSVNISYSWGRRA